MAVALMVVLPLALGRQRADRPSPPLRALRRSSSTICGCATRTRANTRATRARHRQGRKRPTWRCSTMQFRPPGEQYRHQRHPRLRSLPQPHTVSSSAGCLPPLASSRHSRCGCVRVSRDCWLTGTFALACVQPHGDLDRRAAKAAACVASARSAATRSTSTICGCATRADVNKHGAQPGVPRQLQLPHRLRVLEGATVAAPDPIQVSHPALSRYRMSTRHQLVSLLPLCQPSLCASAWSRAAVCAVSRGAGVASSPPTSATATAAHTSQA
jgi:hypothetical protein